MFRSYRADKVLREAHCVDGRVHSVPRELTDVVDAIDESALALNVCMGSGSFLVFFLFIVLVVFFFFFG